MPEPQHTDPVAQFTRQLNHLVAALDPQEGWYAVLLQQDEQAVQSYLNGTSIPPWDVVSSLIDDFDHKRGTAEGARDRARELHHTATRTHDRRFGRQALLDQISTARHELAEAGSQVRRLYEPRPGESLRPQQTADLFPARDRHERATARILELESRLSSLDADLSAESRRPTPSPSPASPVPRRNTRAASAALAAIAFGAQPVQEPEPEAAPPQPTVDPAAVAAALQAARLTSARLADLRMKGLGGQAHITLCEAVTGPDDHTIALVRELERSEQTAEIPTLLWEAASLPPARITTLACALCDADREADARVLLRNASARSPADLAAAAVALVATRRPDQLGMLLEPLLRARGYQKVVQVGQQETLLVPVLLDAARQVSDQHQRELAHALRASGLRTATT